ncbi:MAG: hypothetical protein KJO81_03220 [Gammaproteobacteria bacterium]|nr:hypothetical protein [Gammaproteobacteria bacterium]MBT8123817.1 hypothetical protein [Gammaproteobacteria bacterium]MDH3607972.1 hypothetical protein [Gammaproteobacteria bacterium]NNC68214.1 hypothetical protein [Gammaproteobacteria bacterium]
MEDNPKTNKLSYCGNIIIGLGLIVTISILGYQFYHWLINGEWLPLPFYKPLQYLGISFEGLLDLQWQGLQKTIFWILELPLAGIIGVSSLSIGWLMSMKD